MRRINLKAARQDFAHLVNQVAYGAEVVILNCGAGILPALTRHNRDLAVMLPVNTFKWGYPLDSGGYNI